MMIDTAELASAAEKTTLLDVRNIRTSFRTSQGTIFPVDDVSFSLNRGEVVAIVGESGCGKSITAFSIMGLVRDPGRVAQGEILFEGHDLTRMSALRCARYRVMKSR